MNNLLDEGIEARAEKDSSGGGEKGKRGEGREGGTQQGVGGVKKFVSGRFVAGNSKAKRASEICDAEGVLYVVTNKEMKGGRIALSRFSVVSHQQCRVLSIPFSAFSMICSTIPEGSVSLVLDSVVSQHKVGWSEVTAGAK